MPGDQHVSLSHNGTAAKTAIKESIPATSGSTVQFGPAVDGAGTDNGSLTSQIFAADMFTKVLCMERRRTERSGRRFILMLLDCHSVLKTSDSGLAFKAFVRKLMQTS